MNTAKNRATAKKYDVLEGEAARVGELSERLGTPVEFSDGVVESGMYYNGAIRIAPESSTPAHDVLACDLSRSMQKDPTDYDAFSSALAESPFYKEELSRRGLTPEAYRTSIEQAVKAKVIISKISFLVLLQGSSIFSFKKMTDMPLCRGTVPILSTQYCVCPIDPCSVSPCIQF